MSKSSRRRRAFPWFLLLAALAFASLPARSQAVRGPSAEMRKVAVLGEGLLSRVRLFLASLWHPDLSKEGPSIDPNGQPGQQSDEGITIDPNGQPK